MRYIKMKPSLFIIHDVKHSGGIQYRISDRNTEQQDRTERTNWRTERTIDDVEAFNAARACRARIEGILRTETGAAVSDITGGLFAPDNTDSRARLERAQELINEELDTFRRDYDSGNRLSSRIIVFQIAGENRALLEALSEQVQDGLQELRAAVETADVKRIRAALKSIKGMDKILPADAAASLKGIMDRYKKTARDINAAINKQGKSIEELQNEMDATPIDAATLAIFEPEAADVDALPAMDAADFQTEAADGPETNETTASAQEFATDQTEATDAPAAAPVGLAVDTTAPAQPGADWTDDPDPDPDAAPAPFVDLTQYEDDPDALTPEEAAAAARAR